MVLRSVFHGKLLDDIADDGGEGEGVWVIEFVVSFGSGRGVGGTRGGAPEGSGGLTGGCALKLASIRWRFALPPA